MTEEILGCSDMESLSVGSLSALNFSDSEKLEISELLTEICALTDEVDNDDLIFDL